MFQILAQCLNLQTLEIAHTALGLAEDWPQLHALPPLKYLKFTPDLEAHFQCAIQKEDEMHDEYEDDCWASIIQLLRSNRFVNVPQSIELTVEDTVAGFEASHMIDLPCNFKLSKAMLFKLTILLHSILRP